MSTQNLVYLVFIGLILLALVFDLGLLNKKKQIVSIKSALIQTLFWVSLALFFFVFLWYEQGKIIAFEYLTAYITEWSLSVDNIFVFILIFSAFNVKEEFLGRVLLTGILMAIIFRIIFITVGVALVQKAEWLLYIFGIFLIYTGYKMYVAKPEDEFKPKDGKIYNWIIKYLPITMEDGNGKYRIFVNNKPVYTSLFVTVIILAITDLIFAVDSIPAVMGISRNSLVIYTSNIFAVLGLRSLFFLLRGAVSKFDYLQQGIAIVLVFIGVKMLIEHYLITWITKTNLIFISLFVILICILGSIVYSIFNNKKGIPKDFVEK